MAFLALGDIGFTKQAAQGTTPGTAFFWMPLQNDATRLNPTWKSVYSGLSRSLQYQQITGIESGGNATMYTTIPGIGKLISLWAGGTDVVSGTVDPFTHTIALASADIPWITVQRNFDQQGYCTNDVSAKLEQIGFSGNANDLIMAQAAWKSIYVNTATKTTPTFDTGNPLATASSVITIKQGSTPISGKCTGWDMTLNQTLTVLYGTGSQLPVAILPQVRHVSGKATVTVETGDNLFTNIYGLSNNAVPTGTPQTGSVDVLITDTVNTNHSLELTYAKAVYTVAQPVISPQDGKLLEVPIEYVAVLTSGNDEVNLVVKSADSATYT